MITMTEWVKVQNFLDSKNKKGANTLDASREKTFQGMLRCGECGATITMSKHTKNYANGKTQDFWYYNCTKKIKPCSQPHLNAKFFEPQIVGYIKSLELNPKFSEWIKNVLKRRNKDVFQFEQKQRENNTKRLNEIMDKKEKIYEMKIDGLFSNEEYQKRKESLLVEEALIRESYTKPITNYWERVMENSIDFASSITTLFEEGDIQTRQLVLRILGSNLILKDKKVEIEAKKAFIFLKDIQTDVWAKNAILEPNFMPILPHKADDFRNEIHSCAGERTWTSMSCDTCSLGMPVYQFQHSRAIIN